MKGARGQITLLPTGSLDYIPLNTAIAPFDDMNVRRAVLAGIDRDALRKAGTRALRPCCSRASTTPRRSSWRGLVERSLRRMGFDVRNVPIVRSKDVAAVPNPGIAGWDLASTSLR